MLGSRQLSQIQVNLCLRCPSLSPISIPFTHLHPREVDLILPGVSIVPCTYVIFYQLLCCTECHYLYLNIYSPLLACEFVVVGIMFYICLYPNVLLIIIASAYGMNEKKIMP